MVASRKGHGHACPQGAKLTDRDSGGRRLVPEKAKRERPSENRPVAFGTGLIALDVIVDTERAGHPVLAAGGTCGNVLTALSFLGWACYPVARLNGDAASRLLQEDLARWNVLLDFATQLPSAATPIILQTIRRQANGTPTHSFSLVCPACQSWFPRFLPVRKESASVVLEHIEGHSADAPQVFFFDRVSRGALTLAEKLAARGAVVMFEPSGKGNPSLFQEAMDVAHIVKYSHQRMPTLAEGSVRSGVCQLEIETQGADGLRYRSPHTSWSWKGRDALSGPPTVDTAGAGDWCTAGLLSTLAAGGLDRFLTTTEDELERAIAKAQAAAAIACAFPGARGAMYALGRARFRKVLDHLASPSAQRRPFQLQSEPEHSVTPRSSALAEVCPSCQ